MRDLDLSRAVVSAVRLTASSKYRSRGSQARATLERQRASGAVNIASDNERRAGRPHPKN